MTPGGGCREVCTMDHSGSHEDNQEDIDHKRKQWTQEIAQEIALNPRDRIVNIKGTIM
jgi:hypothetical protein